MDVRQRVGVAAVVGEHHVDTAADRVDEEEGTVVRGMGTAFAETQPEAL
jgi:hypothetical protein